ncbi:hypothetical protein QFZ58_001794 [Streptomyces sp. B1I3]|nr:hypothetical protein [Streptomyces sp. B1I3]
MEAFTHEPGADRLFGVEHSRTRGLGRRGPRNPEPPRPRQPGRHRHDRPAPTVSSSQQEGARGNQCLRPKCRATRQERTGCRWTCLPHDLPSKSAAYYYYAA